MVKKPVSLKTFRYIIGPNVVKNTFLEYSNTDTYL